ncbi:biotin transport system permease protein [Rhodobacter sp. JA431]|uniref:energy-coupling factor transporter transmembrane component T family protein n=1 Tax=Rhodobacter sp. JA431 TaxID=570013 RepID=UPI000BCFE4E1|nr:energy-coupling factor transporter transmembrane protein EcfT [Rhodobacter sp. JA431]SOC17275.1 biotin transport system permease protein [Rhodobacter sp. JA431]
MSRSILHRLPAGLKLTALAAAGSAVIWVSDWRVMVDLLLLVALAFPVARLGRGALVQQLRPLLPMLVVLLLAQGLMASWTEAALVIARIATLVLMAGLVTLTTRTEDLIATVERLLTPLAPLGVNPGKVSLAFSLALRFLPVIAEEAERVREAQSARGLGNSPLALALPLIVRVLKSAEDIADAIEARSGHDDPDCPQEKPQRRARFNPLAALKTVKE